MNYRYNFFHHCLDSCTFTGIKSRLIVESIRWDLYLEAGYSLKSHVWAVSA